MERLLVVKTHYKNGENFTVTIRKLRDYFPHLHPASLPWQVSPPNFVKRFASLCLQDPVDSKTAAYH